MLTSSDVEQFYRVMHSLQCFANQRLALFPGIETLSKFMDQDIETKATVRDALYENIELIEAFIAANPENLSNEDLKIAASWKDGRRAGNFFVERHLKQYSIWIGDGKTGDEVYCVSSLSQPMEELIPKFALPHYVEAVLLPFKGRVIYDGILRHHSISFGGGYRGRLRETYMRAKQNGRLIESLDPSIQSAGPNLVPSRDWARGVASFKKAAAKLKGEKNPITKEVFSVCRESADLAATAVENCDDLDGIRSHGYAVAKALRRLEKALDRAE